jgi:hypothetical protein
MAVAKRVGKVAIRRRHEADMPANSSTHPWSLSEIVTRSLLPLVALLLLMLLPWIGAYAFLVATFVWWRIVTWIG